MKKVSLAAGSAALVVALFVLAASNALAARGDFSKPFVIGFAAGDDWEPEVAADDQGNVYVAWAHYGGVPGCDACGNPSAMIQVSHDRGSTFGEPRPLHPDPEYQVDLQVAVNAAGAVWVAYLNGKDTVVQRSDDLGTTWSTPVAVNADTKNSATDKVGLAVQGEDVYVAFSIAQRFYVASSHDGGETFRSVQLNQRSKDTGWTLTSGCAVDSKAHVYCSWVGVHQSGNALGPQEVFLTKSEDKGDSWSFITLAEDLPPGPGCSEFSCGWDFWGPQMVVTVDAVDTLYVAYNAGLVDEGPPFVWFQASSDGGATWTAREVVHTDGLSDAFHLFPAIEGGSANVVHVSWMDDRLGRFNTYYRTSTDGGETFGPEVILNRDLGFAYQHRNGYDFTYGDYYGIAVAGTQVHVAWGEGPDYIGPGNVFYARS